MLTPLPGYTADRRRRSRPGQRRTADHRARLAGGPRRPERRDVRAPRFDNIAQNAGQCLIGAEGCGSSYTPDLSDDGRYVTFATEADNLVVRPGATPARRSRSAATAARATSSPSTVTRSPTAAGPQHVNEPRRRPGATPHVIRLVGFVDRQVLDPAISGDGRFIAFDTGSRVLPRVLERRHRRRASSCRSTTTSVADVYLREWQPVVDTSAARRLPRHPARRHLGGPDRGPVHPGLRPGAGPGGRAHSAPTPATSSSVSSLNCLPPLPGAAAARSAVAAGAGPRPRRSSDATARCSVAFRPTAVGRPQRRPAGRRPGRIPFSVPAVTQPQDGSDIPPHRHRQVLPGQGGFTAQPSVDLGSQIVTTTSPEGTVTVTNTGDSPFQITNITLGGAEPRRLHHRRHRLHRVPRSRRVVHGSGHVHADGTGRAVGDAGLHRHGARWSASGRAHGAGARSRS